MKIGYVQNSPIFGEKQQNFKEISYLLKGIKADLIVLPEFFAIGYAFTSKEEAARFAETDQGKTAEFLKKISASTGAVVVGGFVEKNNAKIYNAAMTVYKSKVINVYRKIHLFNKETQWFSSGNTPLPVLNIKGMKIGIMVCFDWFFPEVSRTLALRGAQVIAHPANLVLPYCQNAMVTRCLENRVFAVTANRIGNEKRGDDEFTFTGGSQITSFEGKILSSAPKNKPHVDIVEVELNKANNKMINPYNDLFKARRAEFYTQV